MTQIWCRIYFFMPEIFKGFLCTKSPFEFVFQCCEFTDVIVQSQSWYEIFVLKLSGIQKYLKHFKKSVQFHSYPFCPIVLLSQTNMILLFVISYKMVDPPILYLNKKQHTLTVYHILQSRVGESDNFSTNREQSLHLIMGPRYQ